VLSNPPFSLNYSRDGMRLSNRFRWGWAPGGGKKADLMFVQHMVAVLKANGVAATVMPHGVLFRGGAERDIRTALLDDDIIEAVIGLAPNLFYGTGIPACVLVLRAPASKPADRAGKVLFINADHEYAAGRTQNYLLPEHIEKIVYAYEAFTDIPGYARVVTCDELRGNDDNLNIRRYADNAPPPEPHDVRAHLHGGIPKAEVADKADPFTAHGFTTEAVFINRTTPTTTSRPVSTAPRFPRWPPTTPAYGPRPGSPGDPASGYPLVPPPPASWVKRRFPGSRGEASTPRPAFVPPARVGRGCRFPARGTGAAGRCSARR